MTTHHAATLSDALTVSDPDLTARLARLVGDGPTARHARHVRDTMSRCSGCAMPADACARRYERTGGDECCTRCGHPEESPVSWSDRLDAYVWTSTGSPLTFDQCERRGLDGTGRTV